MRVIVAITAASGAIYARQVVDLLLADATVEQVGIIYSANAKEVMAYEGESIRDADGLRLVEFSNSDLFASAASGSARWSAMIVVPCSVGSVARIAAGVSDSLIARAADVMLKERRRLVMVVRETPLSLIHLRNMTTLTEAGAIIMPASPSLYMGARSVEELAMSVSSRAVDMVGASGDVRAWGE
ncbi:MAG: UbiX family flavin prenyltransferase [Rikenellaceae bacterium]